MGGSIFLSSSDIQKHSPLISFNEFERIGAPAASESSRQASAEHHPLDVEREFRLTDE